MIYLDNAATTFPKPECVYQAMDKANRELAFNAGRGSYKAARDAAAVIDEAKSRIANILNASGYADVVFTPSVTHAFNQVLYGLDTSSETEGVKTQRCCKNGLCCIETERSAN